MRTVNRARRLRRELTLPEILLWQALRREATGFKFRKQHPAGDYVLDFYCASARLALEVDGAGHATAEQAEHDRRRDLWLARQGVTVMRIRALDIIHDLANVVDGIVARLSPDQPLHHAPHGPPPRTGEEPKDPR